MQGKEIDFIPSSGRDDSVLDRSRAKNLDSLTPDADILSMVFEWSAIALGGASFFAVLDAISSFLVAQLPVIGLIGAALIPVCFWRWRFIAHHLPSADYLIGIRLMLVAIGGFIYFWSP